MSQTFHDDRLDTHTIIELDTLMRVIIMIKLDILIDEGVIWFATSQRLNELSSVAQLSGQQCNNKGQDVQFADLQATTFLGRMNT